MKVSYPCENDSSINDWDVAGGDNWDDEENGNVINFGITTEVSNLTKGKIQVDFSTDSRLIH